MERIINLDGRDVVYTLVRKGVKNINLRIRSDGTVYVSANRRVADGVIEAFLRKKSSYILSALDRYAAIQKYADNKYDYVTGESFRYLGRDLRLVVSKGKNGITADGVYLMLSVKNIDDAALKKRLIKKWYDAQCRDVFTEIIGGVYPVFQKYGVKMPKLTLREMSSRWGSCQPARGTVTLNKRLIETPRDAVEYVVTHEFTHFLHPNHSKKFYEMLTALMPDWKARKRMLEGAGW